MSHTLISQIAFALENFLLDAEARQLRPATLRYYRQQLTLFLAYVEQHGVHDPRALAAPIIRSYLASLQARGWATASVQSAARAVRAFSNFLVAEALIEHSPMQRVKLPKADRRKPDAFTPDEVKRLLAAAKTWRDKAILLCLLDSGCRVSEFVDWTVGDVNIATGTVHVRHTKNRSERVVYLGTQARALLLKHLGDLPDRARTRPLWANAHTGESLLPNGMRQLLRRIGRDAQVVPCNPHKFRRTFATWCLRNGMNIYDLKTLMGHSGLEMLLHYLDNDAQVAHNQYGAVDGLLSKPGLPTRRTGR